MAQRKVEGLLAAHAAITVVSPRVGDALRALPVGVVERRYEPSDLETVRLVITATDDPAVNASVAADAKQRGIWVNSADDPANCTFTLAGDRSRGAGHRGRQHRRRQPGVGLASAQRDRAGGCTRSAHPTRRRAAA